MLGVLSQNDSIREAARQRERDIRHKELSAFGVAATVARIGRSPAGQLKVVAARAPRAINADALAIGSTTP